MSGAFRPSPASCCGGVTTDGMAVTRREAEVDAELDITTREKDEEMAASVPSRWSDAACAALFALSASNLARASGEKAAAGRLSRLVTPEKSWPWVKNGRSSELGVLCEGRLLDSGVSILQKGSQMRKIRFVEKCRARGRSKEQPKLSVRNSWSRSGLGNGKCICSDL